MNAWMERTEGERVIPAANNLQVFALQKEPCLPAGLFLCQERVMNEGFPPHVAGFMRRKREKERDEEGADA
jgi:hypothetical protein